MRWGWERWEGKGQPDGGQGKDKGQKTKARWQCVSHSTWQSCSRRGGPAGG